MSSLEPLGPQRLNFEGLHDEDFEELVYLVILLNDPEAVRVRAPDFGADAALPNDAGGYARCWQAKRFTGSIAWGQCEESLDRAVEHYPGITHYTFCFARDLTGKQEKLFEAHLRARHKGVKVEWWGASRLTKFLLDSKQGQRIQGRFLGDSRADAAAVMAALRAGGALETGADAAERLRAIGDFFESSDPYFAYVATTRPISITAGQTPGAVMSVEITSGEQNVRIDAVPRNQGALDRLPRGRLLFPDTPAGQAEIEKFERALIVGGEATLQGAAMEFEMLPAAFEELAPAAGEPLEITITAEPRRPAPWDARIHVITDRGDAEIDLDLRPVDPPQGWDGSLVGESGGLTLTLLFRIKDGRGQVGTHWNFRAHPDGLAAQARALAVFDAVHGDGTISIRDRDGGAREIVDVLKAQPTNERLASGKSLIDALVLIEEWSGTPISLPDEIDAPELQAIAEVAHIIRTGRSRMDFKQVQVHASPAERDEYGKAPIQLGMAMEFAVDLFGVEHRLGFLSGTMQGKVERVETNECETDELPLVTLVPADEASAHPTFELTRDRPTLPRPA